MSLRSSEQITIAEPLGMKCAAVEVFQRLSRLEHCVYFDSALPAAELGRYSFISADPFNYMQLPADGSDALTELEAAINPFRAQHVEGLPPFQGGAAGLLGYDLKHSLESIPRNRWNEFQCPAMAIGLYDVVVGFDHLSDEVWIVSSGFPETQPGRRRKRAAQRLKQFRDRLRRPSDSGQQSRQPRAGQRPPRRLIAPRYEVAGHKQLTSNFTPESYRRAVQRAIDYVYAGDIFQVNLSQRLLYPAERSAVDLYLRLRNMNPAPFAGYFDLGDAQIISASPERFLRIQGRDVEARPIKGTRQRTSMPEVDLFSASELRSNDKDRAENIMIVDLLRNDLSKVCEADSVYVGQLCDLEIYQYVQHLVSSVHGRLRPECSPVDLVRASFPGGSITGAPKIRAMEVIAELEPTARGAYCGCLGYIGFDGSTDLNILIRTITSSHGWWQFPVGGGIVSKSDPSDEYEETWHKAEGILRAIA